MTVKKTQKRSVRLLKDWFLKKNKYLDKFLSDSYFRLRITATFGSVWNLIYALYHIILAALFHSFWFLTMGFYYLTACCMRASALHLRTKKADKKAAVKRNARLTFMMAFIFMGVICLSIAEKRNAVYNIVVALSMAIYSFCCIIMAIWNVVCAKKKRNIQTILLRNFSMVYALGIMFGLERMMLGTFGDSNASFTFIMEAVSGAGFLIVIVIFGINLLLLASKMSTGNEL